MVLYSKFFGRAASSFPTAQNRMGFIDKNACPLGISRGNEFFQISKVAVHRIDTLDDDKLTFSALALERGLERTRIVVLEFFGPATRQNRAVAQAKMRPIVQDRDIGFAQETGDGSECAAEATIEQHRVLAL